MEEEIRLMLIMIIEHYSCQVNSFKVATQDTVFYQYFLILSYPINKRSMLEICSCQITILYMMLQHMILMDGTSCKLDLLNKVNLHLLFNQIPIPLLIIHFLRKVHKKKRKSSQLNMIPLMTDWIYIWK